MGGLGLGYVCPQHLEVGEEAFAYDSSLVRNRNNRPALSTGNLRNFFFFQLKFVSMFQTTGSLVLQSDERGVNGAEDSG